ncbi:hypothetical protein SDC9_140603 [bioreactor metagenome]|uniref:Uncharacterized protein n=1 Tax=bioreactor metagenome TaxID=1076179 RepID=A0A645DVV6_9ZZZZ
MAVNGRHKGAFNRLVGRAAMLQKARVVVILKELHGRGEGEGHLELDLVFGLVRPVTPAPLSRDMQGGGHGSVPNHLA